MEETSKNEDLYHDIMYDPKNKNQQRKLLEQIGTKALNEAMARMGVSYPNKGPERQKRLQFERQMIVDDLDSYGGMNPAEYKNQYGKRAYR